MTDDAHVAVLETTTGPDTLAAMQETLDRIWESQSVPDTVKMYMDLAVGEVGANIIAYAGGGGPVRVRMEVRVEGDEVRTTFTDDGKPSSVDLSTVGLPDEYAESGRGLAIALRVLDELSYRRDRNGNHWTLVSRTS